jgi:succinate dehydrogenase / fumarate reductase membrane anchor subunit
MAKMQSPLGRAYGLGSARLGAQSWWTLRIVSVAMVPLILWWVIGTIAHAGADWTGYVRWVGHPVTAVLFILLIATTFYHMATGIQEVLEDYVHVEWLKLVLLLGVRFGSAALAVGGIFAVLRISGFFVLMHIATGN